MRCFAGSTRHSDVQRSLGIATNALRCASTASSRAGSCNGAGTPNSPELFEYLLTDKGRDLGQR